MNLGEQERRHGNVDAVVGDATDLGAFADGQFDVAFSNSVIEHLFTYEAQSHMARELQRVGRAHWVQTPNFWFPIEPHFLVPAWHWLPEDARVAVLTRRGVGWAGRCAGPGLRPRDRAAAPADAPARAPAAVPELEHRPGALLRAREVLDRGPRLPAAA